MLLKGATPDHEGEERPDRWALEARHAEIASRWGIEPERDLRKSAGPVTRSTLEGGSGFGYGRCSRSAQRWSASVSSGRALSRQSA